MANLDSIPKVFLCYAREDNDEKDELRGGPWLTRLRRKLAGYELAEEFSVFSDLEILPGDAWDAEIRNQLEQASIVVVLVSDALLASKYVRGIEMPLILARADRGELQVIPLILNQCEPDRISFPFTDAQGNKEQRHLAHFQCLGSPDDPLLGRKPAQQDNLLAQVAKEVSKQARQISTRKAAPPTRPAPGPKPDSKVSPDSGQTVEIPPVSPGRKLAMQRAIAAGVTAVVLLGLWVVFGRKSGPPAGSSTFTNSLGMVFVPVSVAAGKLLFCVWETRVRDYDAYAKANAGVDGSWKDPERQGVKVTPGLEHPVVNVSWEEAQKFCAWLTTKERGEGRLKTGQRYRLPTDVEWSWAVGLTNEAGPTPKDRDEKMPDLYPWGAGFPPKDFTGNFADELAKEAFGSSFKSIANYRDGYATTSPVGRYPALGNGLYDLSGNVWEWCEDWYDTEQKGRVLRGGSWINDDPGYLLSSCRRWDVPEIRFDSVGFRVVMDGDGW